MHESEISTVRPKGRHLSRPISGHYHLECTVLVLHPLLIEKYGPDLYINAAKPTIADRVFNILVASSGVGLTTLRAPTLADARRRVWKRIAAQMNLTPTHSVASYKCVTQELI